MNSSKTAWIKPALKTFLLELVWMVPMTVLFILLVGYIQVNFPILSEIKLTAYAQGWEAFWVFCFFFSNILYFIVLIALMAEAILFFLRKMGLTAIKGIETIKQQTFPKLQSYVKAVSFITLFKKIKINTMKKALIAYVIALIIVFGSGWLAKTVLKATDSLVYRSHEVIHLNHQDQTYDFSTDITAKTPYDLVIETGMAHVHVYTISDTNEGSFYVLYDTESQLDDYELVIDDTDKSIHVTLNRNQLTYERYVDDVIPAIEIYLPEALVINSTSVRIANQGSLTMEYVTFGDLTVNAKECDTSIKANDTIVGDIAITQVMGSLDLEIDRMERAMIELTSVDATIHLETIADDATLEVVSSEVFLYQMTADALIVNSVESNLEFREVVAPTLHFTLTKGSLLYVNANRGVDSIATIESTDATITLRGVVNDSISND